MNELSREPRYSPEIPLAKCSECGDELGTNPLACRSCARALGPEAHQALLDEQIRKAKKFGLKPRN